MTRILRVKDLFQDSVQDVVQWDGRTKHDFLHENPFNDVDMGGRFYLKIAPWRYTRVYPGDWIIVLKTGFGLICPDEIFKDITRREQQDNGRFQSDKTRIHEPYLHKPKTDGKCVRHSKGQV